MRFLLVILTVLTGCGAQLGGEPPGQGGGGESGSGKGDGDGDGSGSGSGSGSGGMALRAGDFLDQLGVVQCDQAFVCRADFPPDVGVTFEQAIGTTPAECYADASAFYMPAQVEASIAAGRITYDESAAASCVAGITFGATCTEFWQIGAQFPAACDQSLAGTIANGGTCSIDFDCTGVTSICNAGTCVAQAVAASRATRFRSVTP